MSRKVKISEPTEAIGKIFSVVRLLDPDSELKSFTRLYLDKLHRDPEGWFLDLKKDFGIEEAVDEDGDEDEAEIEYILDSEAREEYEKERERVAGRYEIAVLMECLADMPAEFVAYVHLPDPSLESLYETFNSMVSSDNTSFKEFVSMINFDLIENLHGYSRLLAKGRYEDARDYHLRLYRLAHFAEDFRSKDRYSFSSYISRDKLFAIKEVKIIDGKLRFLPDEFTEAFNDVDIDRIKLCGSCKRVFWAKRTDMRGCSIPCAKVLRTRKWREKTTPEQRQNYKINKIKKETQKGAK